jgi:hypothetical protein
MRVTSGSGLEHFVADIRFSPRSSRLWLAREEEIALENAVHDAARRVAKRVASPMQDSSKAIGSVPYSNKIFIFSKSKVTA